MSWRRDDTDSQDSQTAFAPGKTINNGSPGTRVGPDIEAYSLWVPTEMRPTFSEVVHSLMDLAMLFVRRVVALVSLPAKEPFGLFSQLFSEEPYMQETRLISALCFRLHGEYD